MANNNYQNSGGIISNIESLIKYQWKTNLFYSIGTLLLGILAVFFHPETLLAAGVMFGFYLLFTGIIQFSNAFMNGVSTGYRLISALSGVLSIVLAIYAFKNTFESVAMLGLWIAFSFFIGSIGVLSFPTLDSNFDGRLWQILLGVMGLLFSILAMLFPIQSLSTLIIFAGFLFIFFGIFGIVVSFIIKKDAKDLISRI